jgi:hypothetical protein
VQAAGEKEKKKTPIERIRDDYLKGHVEAPKRNIIQKRIKRQEPPSKEKSEPQRLDSGAAVATLLLDHVQ